jgi:hypothetical protein
MNPSRYRFHHLHQPEEPIMTYHHSIWLYYWAERSRELGDLLRFFLCNALEVLLEEVIGFKTGRLHIWAHEGSPENVSINKDFSE